MSSGCASHGPCVAAVLPPAPPGDMLTGDRSPPCAHWLSRGDFSHQPDSQRPALPSLLLHSGPHFTRRTWTQKGSVTTEGQENQAGPVQGDPVPLLLSHGGQRHSWEAGACDSTGEPGTRRFVSTWPSELQEDEAPSPRRPLASSDRGSH